MKSEDALRVVLQYLLEKKEVALGEFERPIVGKARLVFVLNLGIERGLIQKRKENTGKRSSFGRVLPVYFLTPKGKKEATK